MSEVSPKVSGRPCGPNPGQLPINSCCHAQRVLAVSVLGTSPVLARHGLLLCVLLPLNVAWTVSERQPSPAVAPTTEHA